MGRSTKGRKRGKRRERKEAAKECPRHQEVEGSECVPLIAAKLHEIQTDFRTILMPDTKNHSQGLIDIKRSGGFKQCNFCHVHYILGMGPAFFPI